MRSATGLLLSLLSISTAAGEAISDRIELSGFARAVAGVITDENVSFEGYDDGGSLSEQSLIAVQADISLSDKISVAAQLLGHSGDDRESGVEWLYLAYEPSVNWRIKVGRQRTPLLNYSDVLDVGFAYPWITPPTPVYGTYLFTNYEGISLAYQGAYGATTLGVEAYFGQDSAELALSGLTVPIDLEDTGGVVLKAGRGNLRGRIAYHFAGAVKIDFPALDTFAGSLRDAGFDESADSLTAGGRSDIFHLGLRYDTLDYFLESEWLRIDTEVGTSPPRIDTYYGTIGKNFSPFQVHLTGGRSSSDDIEPVDEIPRGLNPVFDALGAAYQLIFDLTPTNNLNFVSTGARWDFRPDMALKAEAIWVEEREPSQYFGREPGAGFDGQTFLLQFALEWVF